MQKMQLDYAQKILDGGYAFGSKFLSRTNDLLVVTYDEDEYPYSGIQYLGTRLKDGKLQTDEAGFVSFSRVKPIIDEHTLWEI
jgi:hypothetical protein